MDYREGVEVDEFLGRVAEYPGNRRADVRDPPVGLDQGDDVRAVLDEEPDLLVVESLGHGCIATVSRPSGTASSYSPPPAGSSFGQRVRPREPASLSTVPSVRPR